MATEPDSIDAGLITAVGLGSGALIAAIVILLQVLQMRLDAEQAEQKGAWRSPATLVGPDVDYERLDADQRKRLTRYGKWQETNPVTGEKVGAPVLHVPVEEAMRVVAEDLAKSAADAGRRAVP